MAARLAVVGLLLLVPLAGCLGSEPQEPPPAVALEDIDYWFEGDALIVNVTMTNRLNYTPGLETLQWNVDVGIREWSTAPGGGTDPGTDLNYSEADSISLSFWPSDTGDWRERWHSGDYSSVGPVFLFPGTTISPEFEFDLENNFTEDEGYYTIRITAWVWNVPRSHEGSASTPEYFTGCFNPDVGEFYGIREDGPDCQYWDCSGTFTESEVGLWRSAEVKEEAKVFNCPLTDGRSPFETL